MIQNYKTDKEIGKYDSSYIKIQLRISKVAIYDGNQGCQRKYAHKRTNRKSQEKTNFKKAACVL